jgi:hypothetical protein
VINPRKLQGECKCAYCERKLESIDYGKGEQDVEHFRPKSSVKAWRVPKALKDQGIVTTDVSNAGGGYYLLSYHPFNYAAACKPCNSALKRDYFPVAGSYDVTGEDPAALLNENPYLIYPLGDFDEAPEDLIRFYGVSPQPTASSGHNRARALVTIVFFKLDDTEKRKNLFRERAMVIVALHPQLEKAVTSADGATRLQAQQLVERFTAPDAWHTTALAVSRVFSRVTPWKPAQCSTGL